MQNDIYIRYIDIRLFHLLQLNDALSNEINWKEIRVKNSRIDF